MLNFVRQSFIRCALVIGCVVALLALASSLTPTPYAHAATCSSRKIASNSTSAEGYTLFAGLFGLYTSSGAYCGQMQAGAYITNPPHGQDGNVYADLETCNGVTVSSNEGYLPTGGLTGSFVTVDTGYATISCGSAAAVFYGTGGLDLYTGTGNLYG